MRARLSFEIEIPDEELAREKTTKGEFMAALNALGAEMIDGENGKLRGKIKLTVEEVTE